MIVVEVLLALPRLLDRRQRRAAVAARVAIRNGLGSVLLVVEDTRVGAVEVRLLERRVRQFAEPIARLGGDHGKDVGSDVPPAEGVRVPVGLDGGYLGVVVVEVVVRRADEFLGDRVSQQDREDSVLGSVILVLVERWIEVRERSSPADGAVGERLTQQNQGVLHKVLVRQQGGEEVPGPLAGEADRGVVTVVGHVRSDEDPLREFVVLQIVVEQREVLGLRQTVFVVGDGIVDDEGACSPVSTDEACRDAGSIENSLVLSHVVLLAGLLIDPGHALKARVRHVLLILAPADSLVFQNIHDGRHVGRDPEEGIIVHAKVLSTNRADIIGLPAQTGRSVPDPGHVVFPWILTMDGSRRSTRSG